MFDIGFWELVTLAIIALLIVGPERLPQVAKDAGRFIHRLKRFIHNTRRELEKELELDEMTELQQNIDHVENLMKQAPDQMIKDTNKSDGV